MRSMKRRSRGFTLMELMGTLAIAGVLLGIGIPSFRGFAQNGRLTGAANDTLVTMITARNEAVRRQSRVSVCPSSTPDSTLAVCDSASVKGYIAFEDKNSNCQHDAGEDLVSYTAVHSEVKQGKNIVCIGFASNGFRVPVAGQPANARAVYCDTRGTGLAAGSTTLSYARGLEVVATGRPAVTRLASDLTLWAGGGSPVTCP